MAEKLKKRESKSKDKSITKPLTKMKTKDDEVQIALTFKQCTHMLCKATYGDNVYITLAVLAYHSYLQKYIHPFLYLYR